MKERTDIQNVYNTIAKGPFKVGNDIMFSQLVSPNKEKPSQKTANYTRTWYKEREM